jgi:NAD(P)-dependent dehydrogenase (short-subunit alcohol dehydrogenase family)
MQRFVGKTVIVTGAGYGIGRGIAMRFGKEGAKVGILDLDLPRAEETAKLIAAAGGTSIAVKADVSNSADVKKAVDEVASKLGPIDILVPNAGVRYIKKVLETTDEEWNKTISVNLTGMFYVARAVIPYMQAKGYGKIVIVGSMSGLIGQSGRAAYGASKSGTLQLARSLAVELGPKINVNAVAPGYIAGTGMMTEVDKDTKTVEWMVGSTPVGRPGTTEDIAAAVAFLASDEASFITGATLMVDGGFSAARYMVAGKF